MHPSRLKKAYLGGKTPQWELLSHAEKCLPQVFENHFFSIFLIQLSVWTYWTHTNRCTWSLPTVSEV